jgi:hypothetical protein
VQIGFTILELQAIIHTDNLDKSVVDFWMRCAKSISISRNQTVVMKTKLQKWLAILVIKVYIVGKKRKM